MAEDDIVIKAYKLIILSQQSVIESLIEVVSAQTATIIKLSGETMTPTNQPKRK